jgi:hypothetical protein
MLVDDTERVLPCGALFLSVSHCLTQIPANLMNECPALLKAEGFFVRP